MSIVKIGDAIIKLSTLNERVKRGDTLFKVAQSYKVDCDELYQALKQYRIPLENWRRIEAAYERGKAKQASALKGEIILNDTSFSKKSNDQTMKKKNDKNSVIVNVETKDSKKQEEEKMEGITVNTRAQGLKEQISACGRKIEELETKLTQTNKEIEEISTECSKKNEELASICKMLEQAKFDLEKCKFRATAADERKKSFEKELSESKTSLESMQKELMLLEVLVIEVIDGKVKVSNEAYLPKPEMISETSTKFFLSGEYEMLTGQQIKLLATVCIILDEAIVEKKQYRINYDSLPSKIVDFVKAYENSVNDITE